MMTRRKFLASLLAIPAATKVCEAVADHAELSRRVDLAIIDQTKLQLKRWVDDQHRTYGCSLTHAEITSLTPDDMMNFGKFEYRANANGIKAMLDKGYRYGVPLSEDNFNQIFAKLYALRTKEAR